jgi:predicted RNA-binding Zn ribbon-like protein
MVPEDGKNDVELGLDFANTVDWRNGRLGKVSKDSLTDYDALVGWSVKHAVLRAEQAKRIARIAKESRRDKPTFQRAVRLREIIYRVFSAIAHDRKPGSRDLELLNEFASESLAKSRIVPSDGRFRWSLYSAQEAPDMMLWPIAMSAADLLTSERLADVKECANEQEGCGWLFLDCTKNHKRVWCSTTGCGNRARVRRFYEAHREAPDLSTGTLG